MNKKTKLDIFCMAMAYIANAIGIYWFLWK